MKYPLFASHDKWVLPPTNAGFMIPEKDVCSLLKIWLVITSRNINSSFPRSAPVFIHKCLRYTVFWQGCRHRNVAYTGRSASSPAFPR